MSDGRLVFSTKIDNSDVPKDMKNLERQIKQSQESISKMQNAKLPLLKQAEQLGASLDAARGKLEKLKTQMQSIEKGMEPGASPAEYLDAYSARPYVEAEIKETKKEVAALQKQWDSVNDKLDDYSAKIRQSENSIRENTAAAQSLATQLVPSSKKVTAAIEKADRTANKFNRRLWEIAKSAFVFNIVSSGLRKMVSYMGQAMIADQSFAGSMSALNGSILTAFQPIYEVAVPAITTLINWLNVAVQIIGRFFAALSGKSYSQMQKNAKALNKQAGALGSVGNAAEEAKKQLMGFDEINRLESTAGGGSGAGGGGGYSPSFEEIEIPNEWEAVIESLAMRIKDILFKWDDLTAEDIAEKLVVGLGALAGGLIGFALGGPGGATIGVLVGAGIGIAIAKVLFNNDGELSQEELLSALTVALTSIAGGLIGFAVGGPLGAALGMTLGAALGVKLSSVMFDGDGKLSASEIVRALVAGLSILAGGIIGFAAGGPAGAVMGATVGLALAFSIQSTAFDGVEQSIQEMLSAVRDYFSTTFSEGFIHGLATMVEDGVMLLWNFFVDFVNNVIDNWNSIWGGISSYHTTGTIAPASVPPTSPRSIPALASGAVLPANKPFLAMVGDQRNGTNIEAPLETIKQALAEVMAQYGGGNVEVVFTGELAALGRVLAPVISKAQRDNDRGRGR